VKAATKQKLYRGAIFVVAFLCVAEALCEWIFWIPWQDYYFPADKNRLEILRPVCFSTAALLCMLEGFSLRIYQRLGSR
jgi:hypothetical protein